MNPTLKVFIRKDYKTKNGEYPVYLRYIINRKKKDISLNLSISKIDDFDEINNHVKGGQKMLQTNMLIKKALKTANDIIFNSQITGKFLSTDEFETLFKNKPVGNSYFDFALQEVELMKPTVSYGHYRQHKYEISKLRKFRKEILWEDLNYKLLQNYENYMRDVLKNCTNTVTKTFKRIKTICNIAVRKGVIKESPFNDYRLKSEPSKRLFLEIEELKNLENLYTTNTLKNYNQRVLKYFLFCCYTGLRYNDVKNLKYKDIIKISDNEHLISIAMHKTKDIVRIPLSNKALQLIPKGELANENVFKVAANTVVNRYLHEICEIAKITKNITFHCSRHTFATLGLTLGIPIEVMSKLLGHTDLKITQAYGKIIDKVKFREMEKFNVL